MRTKQPFYLNKAGMLATLIAAAFSPYAFALTPAGKIDFAFGTATATGADGTTRPLKKGTEVYTGDAITTTDGRVQIRFSDGAYVALQPNTLFKVDQYAYEGKSDGKEKGSFSLVKGGLRTITGAIGKVNKQNYEVRTPTATIGIRGTGYSAESNEEGTTVSVHTGLVSVSNQGGSITLSKGQSTFVPTSQSSPQMTDQQAAADQIAAERKQQEELEQQTQTERPLDTQTVFTAGDQRTSSGDSLPLTQIPTTSAAGGPDYYVARADRNGLGIVETSATTTFSDNRMISHVGSNYTYSVASASQVEDAGWDGVIGWGRWTGAINNGEGTSTYEQNEGLSYITGKTSPATALSSRNGTTVTYNLVGATSPSTTNTSNQTSSLGSFSDNAYAVVNFSATSTLRVHATVSDAELNVNYNMADFQFQIGNQSTFTDSRSFSGATASINGAFMGNNAERLGIVYDISSGNNTTTGAAAFAAGASQPTNPP